MNTQPHKLMIIGITLLVMLTACIFPAAAQTQESTQPNQATVGVLPVPPNSQLQRPSVPASSPITVAELTPVTEAATEASPGPSYPIVDSGQGKCYNNNAEITCPLLNSTFYGQDAQYSGNTPRYQDNGDGTVSDLVTGLMWQQDPGEKMTYQQAVAGATSFTLAGYDDWRLPSIKELYSLILFDGTDPSVCPGGSTCAVTPFIDTHYFNFSYGNSAAGERIIDSQFASNTKYASTTMNGAETMFGVNFADGRIKGYGTGPMPGQSTGKLFYVLYVRGNPAYGQNNFVLASEGQASTGSASAAAHPELVEGSGASTGSANASGGSTITDTATGLTWMQTDSGAGMNWEAALGYCEALDYAGASDWRLPGVKELQSIVDYSRSPDTTHSAAIDPLFSTTTITNEAGQSDYPFYWSSTTHASSDGRGTSGAYVSFGRALGYMQERWMDVHGAGAQRSDPKTGNAADYPQGRGPQGDAIRVQNYVRCVRGGNATAIPNGNPNSTRPSMTVESIGIEQGQPGGMPGGQSGQQGSTPPQAAIEACASRSVGSACQFNSPHGIITGACRLIQQQLACAPAGGAPAGGAPAGKP